MSNDTDSPDTGTEQTNRLASIFALLATFRQYMTDGLRFVARAAVTYGKLIFGAMRIMAAFGLFAFGYVVGYAITYLLTKPVAAIAGTTYSMSTNSEARSIKGVLKGIVLPAVAIVAIGAAVRKLSRYVDNESITNVIRRHDDDAADTVDEVIIETDDDGDESTNGTADATAD
jgi:hypothetical protein